MDTHDLETNSHPEGITTESESDKRHNNRETNNSPSGENSVIPKIPQDKTLIGDEDSLLAISAGKLQKSREYAKNEKLSKEIRKDFPTHERLQKRTIKIHSKSQENTKSLREYLKKVMMISLVNREARDDKIHRDTPVEESTPGMENNQTGDQGHVINP